MVVHSHGFLFFEQTRKMMLFLSAAIVMITAVPPSLYICPHLHVAVIFIAALCGSVSHTSLLCERLLPFSFQSKTTWPNVRSCACVRVRVCLWT